MTENLAGRGEGLKELVARLVVMRDGADADARLAEEDSIQQWEAIGRSFAFNESAKQLAALEAAAPAGTARGLFPLTKEQIDRITARVQPQIEHEFIHGYTSATAQVLRVLND